LGNSKPSDHKKWINPPDFNETWYVHTLSEVINPHPFLASYVAWLLSYNFSKI